MTIFEFDVLKIMRVIRKDYYEWWHLHLQWCLWFLFGATWTKLSWDNCWACLWNQCSTRSCNFLNSCIVCCHCTCRWRRFTWCTWACRILPFYLFCLQLFVCHQSLTCWRFWTVISNEFGRLNIISLSSNRPVTIKWHCVITLPYFRCSWNIMIIKND